ncbi:MAG: hypothetical protein SOU03_08585, partial [Dorea sp.]|nr:hypothetical protein [Dorea sp.]
SLTITDSEGTKNTGPLKGADGISSYTHIKYSDDGETFTGIGNLASQNRDDWVAGYYSSATTVDTEEPDKSTTSYTRICMKTAFKVIPGKTYKLNTGYTASDTAVRMGYTAYLADGSCKRAVLPNYNNASYTIPDDVTHVRIYMFSASATSLDTWTEWFESGAVAPIFGEPAELLGSYPGAWMGTLVDNNEVASLTFSDYTWKKIEGEPGADGEPTGITVSETEPEEKFVGMLWKNTGTTSGLVQGATYRWTGEEWEMYKFSAVNIEAETFKGYEFNGSIFCSEFTETISDFSRYVGKMRIENGKIQITCTSQTRASVNDSWIPGPERTLTLNYEGLGFSENGVSELLDLSNLQALFSLLSGHKFSSDSNATGETWINGKPIYSKVINYGAIASTGENTTISKEHGISNVENIWIDLSNSFLVASGKYYPIIRQQAMGKTSSVSWSSSVHVRPSVDASKIYLDIGSNANFDDSYITVRYTKTTD